MATALLIRLRGYKIVATLAQIQSNIDSALNGLLVGIQNRQDSYSAGHGGRAWQGLRSHTVNPADDAQTAPDIGTTCPADQIGEPWHAAVRSGNERMAIQCNAYRGPQGDGYEVAVFTTGLGVEYCRIVNVGPETYRNQAWRAVTWAL